MYWWETEVSIIVQLEIHSCWQCEQNQQPEVGSQPRKNKNSGIPFYLNPCDVPHIWLTTFEWLANVSEEPWSDSRKDFGSSFPVTLFLASLGPFHPPHFLLVWHLLSWPERHQATPRLSDAGPSRSSCAGFWTTRRCLAIANTNGEMCGRTGMTKKNRTTSTKCSQQRWAAGQTADSSIRNEASARKKQHFTKNFCLVSSLNILLHLMFDQINLAVSFQ